MKFVVFLNLAIIMNIISCLKIKKYVTQKEPILIGDDCQYYESSNKCDKGLSCHKYKLVCLIQNHETCYNSTDCLSGFCNKKNFKCEDIPRVHGMVY